MKDTVLGKSCSKFRRWSALALAASIAIGLSGCADYKRRQHLHSVAKNWCETIRASQVIPVYPLTEDLRPGDVFLVQRSIAEQHKDWKGDGFLALDDHRVRLGGELPRKERVEPADWYRLMYFDAYWDDTFGDRLHPRATNPLAGPIKPDASKGETEADVAWKRLVNAEAPRAAFPSYSFKVETGKGLGLAIPVKGVPVGLSFMRSADASGTVTLADAYTYGADADALYRAARAWAAQSAQQGHLYAAADAVKGKLVFLRVVTRVYLVGSVAVSLHSTDTGGAEGHGGADVGSPTPPNGADASENQEKLLTLLDERANKPFAQDASKKLIPGGAVKFAWATARSVSLNETFPTPLVVGYLAFDIPVFPTASKGQIALGSPLPTWQVLNNRFTASSDPRAGILTPDERSVQTRLDALEGAVCEQALEPALRTMRQIGDAIGTPELEELAARAGTLVKEPGLTGREADVRALWRAFRDALNAYTAQGGATAFATLRDEFDNAYPRRFTDD